MRLAIFLLICSLTTAAQTPADSVETLSLSEVLELARENHPLIRQANLQGGFAEAEVRSARGLLDPKLEAGYASKELKGKEYYQKFGSALKIPVWFPIDPKIELYRNEGAYLNPENYVSSSADYWQMASGISVPIGQGLFIDERRSMIKQAKIYVDMAEAEKIKAVNKALLTIIKSYWEWYLAYREFQLMQQSITIAENLFERIKIDYGFGEAAVIDTVQAKITYQNRKIDLRKARLALTQARLNFSVHLWGPNEVPLEVGDQVIPVYQEQFGIVPSDSSMTRLAEWASNYHPEILKMQGRKGQLEVEQRWNREMLKPEINLSYSLINAPFSYEGIKTPEWQNSYKLGVDFYFPIFLRKERGKLQKTTLNLESIDYDLVQLRQEIIASVKSNYAELVTNEELAQEYQSVAENYQRLLNAELFNLETGESDLFKLNIQQDKYIEAQVKYLNALVKLQKLKATLPYAAGLPFLSYRSLYE